VSIFEPVFLLLAVAAVGALLRATVLAATGRGAAAARVLRRVVGGASLYFAVVIVVSAFVPARPYRIGEMRCFDDWCLTVTDVRRSASAEGRRYDVTLRLSNRARRRPMGERGTVAYVVDASGRRFDPIARPDDVPFDTILQPGESVSAIRRFEIPADARDVGFVYAHEGGFPIGWFIIGEGGWFQKRAAVPLD